MRYLTFFLLLLLLISCKVSQTSFTSVEINDDARSLNDIMVLHLGYDKENRRLIEEEITYWLNDMGHSAAPANRYLDEKSIPGKLELARVIKEEGFDGILITRLSDVEISERFENTQQRYSTSPNDPIFYNYIDAYRNQYSGGYTFTEKAWVVDSRLFSAEESDPLYESISETLESGSFEQTIGDFAKALARNIHQNKLLNKKTE